MLRIGIDFDSTLFPTTEKVLEVYNRRHHTNIELSQITKYNLSEIFNENVVDELLELFCDQEIYVELRPYKGAIRAIKTLIEDGNEIYIATSCDLRNLRWKEQLLQTYFPFVPKDNLIRIHNKRLLDVDVLVEDRLSNLISTFADRVCFNQPWNQDKEKDYVYNISRFDNWGEFVNIINNIERENKEWNE